MALLMRQGVVAGSAAAPAQRRMAASPSTGLARVAPTVQQQHFLRARLAPSTGTPSLVVRVVLGGAYPGARQQQQQDEEPSNKLFVSNLPYDASEQDIADFFGQMPSLVNVRLLLQDGRSKGMAVIEYQETEAAANALESLRDSEIGGRNISLRFNRPPPPRAAYGERTYEPRAPREPRQYQERPRRDDRPPRPQALPGTQIIVKNVPFAAEWMDLKEHFSQVGEVVFVSVPKNEDNRPRGFAILQYAEAEGARRALEELNESEMDGRPMYVHEFVPRERVQE